MATAIAPRKIALSFSGSGHLHAYQLGAAHHLLTGNHRWADRITHFAGASGGAIAASVCALLPRERVSEFAEAVSTQGFGFNGASEALQSKGIFAISESDVQRVSESQTLFLSATHCRTGRNALFSHFPSAAALHRALLASCAIPKAFHPFDLVRANPTYPEANGIIVDPGCEYDGGQAAAHDAAMTGALPFSPHGEAYVDGGITNTAPLLHKLPTTSTLCTPPVAATLTCSPISGPHGCVSQSSRDHFHLCPSDASVRVPWWTPALAGMRCHLSIDNLRAFKMSLGAREHTLTEWFRRGRTDAERFTHETEPPDPV